MGARTARLALAVYAVTVGLAMGVGLWYERLIAVWRVGGNRHDVDLQLKLLQYAHPALMVVGIIALLGLTQLPAITRLRRLAIAAAATAGLDLVINVGVSLMAWHVSVAGFDRWLRLSGLAQVVLHAASQILLLVLAMRLARAGASQRLYGVALAALVLRALLAVVWLTPLGRGAWSMWTGRGCQLVIIVVCAGLAALVTRLPASELPPSSPASDGKLGPEWRAAQQGIGLYLGAGIVRVFFSLVGFAVMASARGAQSLHDLRDLRGVVLFLAVLSGLAAVAMLIGLWRIACAPLESGASGPASLALVLGILGLLLDGWSTSITAASLDGDLSAAFFAMKALPLIAAVSAVLGVGLGASLLQALARLATALGCPDVAERARGAIGVIVGAGVALGLGFAVGRYATELLLIFAVLGVPLAIVAVVQLVRVALAVSRVIGERST
jgi:hypothetical protein